MTRHNLVPFSLRGFCLGFKGSKIKKNTFPRHLKIAVIQLFLFTPLLSADMLPFAEKGLDEIRSNLETIRLDESSIKIAKGRNLPESIPAVETFFSSPLSVSTTSTKWADAIEAAENLSSAYQVALEVLGSTLPTVSQESNKHFTYPFTPGTPPWVKKLFSSLYQDFKKADFFLQEGIKDLSKEEKDGLLSLYEWPFFEDGLVRQEISVRRIKKKYAAMKKFDQASVLKAGQIVLKSLDQHESYWLGPNKPPLTKPVRWETDLGDFIIRPSSNDTYKEDDLKNVAFLLDLGGKNHYHTPVAAAGPGEIRVAIDLGSSVTIESTSLGFPSAGSGIFGIGVLSLPVVEGVKKINSHSFSQGVGVGGVGALFIKGRHDLRGIRTTQGAGIFGVGLLMATGSGSSYWAERNGQGLGMTRGVGIFSFKGYKSKIEGGLTQPDPREPMGSVSLCQGVGFGRRAYVGGGAGFAIIKGDDNRVIGSYFAQGCGYWHALGVFRVSGDHNVTQARRYDLGSGVHSAFGHFQLFGNYNTIQNWGVGPAYGWDNSFGSSLMKGSHNKIQTTKWGTGMGSIGSYSFSYYEGDNNRFALPNFGAATYYRRRSSYALNILKGKNNLYQRGNVDKDFSEPFDFMFTPWGSFLTPSIGIRKDLQLRPPQWQKDSQGQRLAREKINLGALISQAEKTTGEAKVSELIDVASAFSLDKKSPRIALKKLMSLPSKDVPHVVKTVDPAAVEQLIRQRVILSAYGDLAAKAILDQFKEASADKKKILMSQFGFHSAGAVLPFLKEKIQSTSTSKESKTSRRQAASVVGTLLNKDSGEDPGGRRLLLELDNYFSNGSKKKRDALLKLLSRTRPWESFAVLSFLRPGDQEARLLFLDSLTEDITDTIKEKGAETILTLLEETDKSKKSQLKKSLKALDQAEAWLRPELFEMIRSTKTSNIRLAIDLLGRLAHPDDIKHISPFLQHSKAVIRETAGIAMGRMGKEAKPALETLFESGDQLDKCVVMAALSHSVSDKLLPLLKEGLSDSDRLVRLTAVSVVRRNPPSFRKHRKGLFRFLKKRAKEEPDASVRFSIQDLVKL